MLHDNCKKLQIIFGFRIEASVKHCTTGNPSDLFHRVKIEEFSKIKKRTCFVFNQHSCPQTL
jgi:hypothetical protein